MNGQLSEHPLAELIRELDEKRLSGSLRVEHEHSKVVIYLQGGKVIYTASNVRSLRLAEYLKKREMVDEQQLAKFSDKRSDLALAAALSASGFVAEGDIEMLVRNLVADALRLALLWNEGLWHFDGRSRLTDSFRVEVDTARFLLECARKMCLNFVSSRFRNPEELIVPGTRSISIGGLLPNEGFLLSRVEGEMRLRDLVALSGLREPDAVRIIYGLALAGFLKREQWHDVFQVQTRTDASKPATTAKATPLAETQRSEEEELKDFLARIDAALNHYEVLNISSDTVSDDIKQVYYGAARKYHPDRFRGKAESPLHARIESAFARITQAYETLMDAGQRAAYDAKLAAKEKAKQFATSAPRATVQSKTPPSQDPESPNTAKASDAEQVENNFREGFAALQQGQVNLAIGLLAAAARAVPTESRYRAYYGRALATNEKTRRSAETELQAAIRLEPANAKYRVMLSELYQDLGFTRRAVAELERALAADPGNAAARDLLKKLK